MTEQYTILTLFQDVANQASVDRAGAWLLLAADDYPWLFSAIMDNLDAKPETVVEAASKQSLIAGMFLANVDRNLLHAFIVKLQAFFREKGY